MKRLIASWLPPFWREKEICRFIFFVYNILSSCIFFVPLQQKAWKADI